jgi:hypothetical protein
MTDDDPSPPSARRSHFVELLSDDEGADLPPSDLSLLSARLIEAERRHQLAGRVLARIDLEADALEARRGQAGSEAASARIALLQVRRRMQQLVSGNDDSADVDVLDEIHLDDEILVALALDEPGMQ